MRPNVGEIVAWIMERRLPPCEIAIDQRRSERSSDAKRSTQAVGLIIGFHSINPNSGQSTDGLNPVLQERPESVLNYSRDHWSGGFHDETEHAYVAAFAKRTKKAIGY